MVFQSAIGAEVVPGNSRWRTQIGTSILTTDGLRVNTGEPAARVCLMFFVKLRRENGGGIPDPQVQVKK
jgi:hypothetical protein